MEPNDTVSPAGGPRPRPRGRTALIIAAAALLGISGGTAVGYGIQAQRPPTPLPTLAQPGLGYPAKPLPAGKAPAPLPASEDRQVRTDGDLRKLLVERPKGAKASSSHPRKGGEWLPFPEYVREFKGERAMFLYLAENDLRRIAVTGWAQGKYRESSVTLVQFRSNAVMGAADHFGGQLSYMPEAAKGAGNAGDPLEGTGSGRYFLYAVEREAGYLPFYRARALAVRGDIMIDINITDSKPISKKDIRVLAERQLERL
ncbi:hypothetical protein ACFV2I_32775 [Streptomyces microflavus]|uniref:Uncharacterized protein n=1 Tax=Streptomyces microflavus TaxID=1919 RepID=A0A6N9V386_STRMI|nr:MULTISPECIES: hypothetical protein [Streptomyces]MBW3360030.1 hypothetical protein [Streptomyces sp. 09ZI22]NEB66085.1 hypothetical protein [Streptomyces microflavus]QQZ55482.1 hypothetical protein IFE09_19135 [Streptomyces microflavus]WTF70745.1 hypothetical protein OH770_19970 [Streptomyces microflavus]